VEKVKTNIKIGKVNYSLAEMTARDIFLLDALQKSFIGRKDKERIELMLNITAISFYFKSYRDMIPLYRPIHKLRYYFLSKISVLMNVFPMPYITLFAQAAQHLEQQVKKKTSLMSN